MQDTELIRQANGFVRQDGRTVTTMAEYVKIYCCGDCVYYDWKKHKCKRGAKVDDGSQFFRDCPIGIHEERDGERHDGQGTEGRT